MKNKFYNSIQRNLLVTFFMLTIIFSSHAQKNFKGICDDWKQQTANYVVIGYTTNNENDYIWEHKTNQLQGIPKAQNTPAIDYNDMKNDSINRSINSSISKKANNLFLIKISPFQMMGGDFITNSYSVGFSVENAIKKPYSFHFGARYIFTDKNDFFEKRMIVVYVEQVNGFGIDAEFRRYSTKKPEMAGYYLSLNLKTVYTKAIYSGFIVKRSSFSTYVNIGWQELYRSGFVFDIAVGVGLRFVTSNSDTGSNPFYHTSEHISDGGKKPYHSGSALFPFVNLNLNIGYAFKVKAKK